jgi:hypothetical protein
MPERRRFHRWTCRFSCRYGPLSQEQTGTVSDLSYGGARISEVEVLPQEGIDIDITIFPGEHSKGIELTAHVSYVNPEGFFGVQFYLKPEEKSRLLLPIFRTHLYKD